MMLVEEIHNTKKPFVGGIRKSILDCKTTLSNLNQPSLQTRHTDRSPLSLDTI